MNPQEKNKLPTLKPAIFVNYDKDNNEFTFQCYHCHREYTRAGDFSKAEYRCFHCGKYIIVHSAFRLMNEIEEEKLRTKKRIRKHQIKKQWMTAFSIAFMTSLFAYSAEIISSAGQIFGLTVVFGCVLAIGYDSIKSQPSDWVNCGYKKLNYS